MNIKEMSAEELIARQAEIRSAVDAEDADLETLETEARAIKDELEARAAEAARKEEIRKMVAEGKAPVKEVEKQEDKKMPTLNEIRSSREYEEAYLKALKTKDDSEVRALLTTGTTGEGLTGYVPVPTALESEIRTAWEAHELFGLVQRSNFKGNIKIGFELTATGAEIHVEGTQAPDEEVVTLGTVEIKNQMIKKWIRVSDEALEGTTVDTASYIYREMAYRIVDKAEEVLVDTIIAAPAAATVTAVGVPVLPVAAVEADTIVKALGLLSGAARDLRVAMNRQSYAVFRALELNGQYALDVFEGLKDRIVFTDKLPAFGSATNGQTFCIIGDFGRGAQMNTPNGDEVMLLTDPYTDAESDLVKIVGRLYAGFGVVADKHFVKLTKGAQG